MPAARRRATPSDEAPSDACSQADTTPAASTNSARKPASMAYSGQWRRSVSAAGRSASDVSAAPGSGRGVARRSRESRPGDGRLADGLGGMYVVKQWGAAIDVRGVPAATAGQDCALVEDCIY